MAKKARNLRLHFARKIILFENMQLLGSPLLEAAKRNRQF